MNSKLKIAAFVIFSAALQFSNTHTTDAAQTNKSDLSSMRMIQIPQPADGFKARAEVARQVTKARSGLWFTAEFLGL